MKSDFSWIRLAVVVVLLFLAIAIEAARQASQIEPLAPYERPRPRLPENCVADDPPPAPPADANFLVDVTDQAGLDFVHRVGPLGTYFMPESIGAGGAMFDYDNDGRQDIYLVNCGRSPQAVADFPEGTRTENRLFRQGPDGVFQDVTEAAGLGDTGYAAGCAVGDVDNDGDLDVFITNYGPDRLYANNGDGTFRDVTEAAGVHNPDWGTCAAFLDYDRDGWLDLFVVNYTADPRYQHSVACGFLLGIVSYCGPLKFLPTVDRLFHNEGLQVDEAGQASVQFREVTQSAGVAAATSYGFGTVCADFSGDGWLDMFVASDAAPNRLWVNQRDGTFAEQAAIRGVAVNRDGQPEAGMGVAAGDVNHDGRCDLVVSHLSTESTTLYLSQPEGDYLDATQKAGLHMPTLRRTGWGAALLDLNHDGLLDLPLVHGLVVPCHSGFPPHGADNFKVHREFIEDAEAFWRDYADLNLLLMGEDRGVFRDQSRNLGGDFCAALASGRALIHGDIDNDGDVDLLVTNCGGRARLYRNDFPKRGHWLMVRVEDPLRNRTALGAEVLVKAEGRWFHKLVSPASSYLASNDLRVHFGFGQASSYEEIVVRWPDGPVETAAELFSGGETDRVVTIRRGEGRPQAAQ